MDNKSETLLAAYNLTLSYSDKTAVDDVSLQLQRGEILGLLGLNGAGKSSTLRMLAGVQMPHQGQVLIGGVSLQERAMEARGKIGYLPETAPLYVDMRLRDYLVFAGRLRRVPADELQSRVTTVLSQLQLNDCADRIIGKLSKGYKQRAGLAQALVHDPVLLILDEPSSGLDPEQMREMRELIRSLGQDKGVIFSSHLLSEVTEICDRVSVMHQGKLIYQGGLGDAQHNTGRYLVRFSETVSKSTLLALPDVRQADASGVDNGWALSIDTQDSTTLLRSLVNADLAVLEFSPERPSLENLFSSLVKAGNSAVPSGLPSGLPSGPPSGQPPGVAAGVNNR